MLNNNYSIHQRLHVLRVYLISRAEWHISMEHVAPVCVKWRSGDHAVPLCQAICTCEIDALLSVPLSPV